MGFGWWRRVLSRLPRRGQPCGCWLATVEFLRLIHHATPAGQPGGHFHHNETGNGTVIRKWFKAALIAGMLCTTATAGHPLPWKKNMQKHDYHWRSPGSNGQFSPSRGWGRRDDRGFGGGLNVWKIPPKRMVQRSETKGVYWAGF